MMQCVYTLSMETILLTVESLTETLLCGHHPAMILFLLAGLEAIPPTLFPFTFKIEVTYD